MANRKLILAPFAVIFFAFGIYMLIAAYHQDHPVVFLALFFSSSLIILLSAAFLAGVIYNHFKPMPPDDERE